VYEVGGSSTQGILEHARIFRGCSKDVDEVEAGRLQVFEADGGPLQGS
jgi:hypothetical protein